MGQTDGQTDGRTPDRDIDPAPHAGSVNNGSIHQGCSPKKKWGTPETRLRDKDF